MRLLCYSENKSYNQTPLSIATKPTMMHIKTSLIPIRTQKRGRSTYPTFQGVWPNLYATDKFYVHDIADAYLFILLHMFFRGQTSGTLLSNKQQTLLF